MLPAVDPATPASLADLIWLNTADILSAFGLPRDAGLRGPLELICRPSALRFARQLARMDAMVGAGGLGTGGAWMAGQLGARLELRGPQPPPAGPLLIIANHPGLLDACALAAAIGRPDLRVLAADRAFLRALPQIAARMIPMGDGPSRRMAAVREAARHLRAGGALLTFPAGRIEPDPRALSGAADSLAGWSSSVDLFARLAGGAAVVPAIVGGVLSPQALAHPLARLRRAPQDRQWLAAIIQLIWPRRFPVRVCVQIGQAIWPDGGEAVSAAALAEAARLIAEVARP
ncbi:glycerol acyltransferase [Oscillochloris sp. ZM17-4]|uniref:1-acyl-sn-glycerol-3-phosphate acyltransferase n=1 Tax=Oscillochloris sp. ZM17-4 TaxID=2866714 RepID=UPI001C72BA8A|nr:1-acyl-sn-glycerol-3-phosphate acyltransferase [Oscillochloris sp. ZM17-4]MBX0327231.1 glycerol acyltransferase [Oscillochloris sp. ZM17-4]